MRPRPPFRLDLTAWALRRLPINQMDRWDGATYRRVLSIGGDAVGVAVTQTGRPEEPELRVEIECGAGADGAIAERVRRELTAMLGLDADLSWFYELAADHLALGRLVERFRGLRPPRFPSVFEGLVNGIACQQLSLNVGITVLNRLTEAFGAPCGEQHAFPRPADLADRQPDALRRLGFSVRKAENIIGVARAIDSGQLDLDKLAGLEDAAAVEELDRLPGVGRWTAQYVALRGLGRWDVFPADDVGSQNKIKQWLSLEKRPDYDEVNRRIADFRPYRGLIYFHLLLNFLTERGDIDPAPRGA